MFILVAPALFAATIYMELGRIIMLCDGAHHSLVPLRWLTKIFVAGDVLSFVMQALGKLLSEFTLPSDLRHRRWNHGQQNRILSEQRPESHHRRLVRPGHLLHLFPYSRHRLPATHQQETHHPFERSPMEEAHARPLSGQRLDPDPINP